jgi:branched-chain amino acid transport system ATP-binding protein
VIEQIADAPLLSVRNLGAGYGDLRVVWDVSVDVWAGQVTVLLGRNGAGKTTTLRAISGLGKIMSGTVTLAGADISDLPAHKRARQGMAYVQEGKRVFRQRTVEQNLLLGGYGSRVSKTVLRERLEGAYELFPVLAAKRKSVAGSMSGGQQQMLAIGQALMAEPQLLLLDEPSGGLAPAIVSEVMQRIHMLRDQGLGILLVEQAVEASIEVADHVAVLDMGRLVLEAEAKDVADITVFQEAYFGRHPTSPASWDRDE